jgi:XFP N-terminal domain
VENLGEEERTRIHAYWRAANYLSVGRIYLLDNPLLREPLAQARQAAPVDLLPDDMSIHRSALRTRFFEPSNMADARSVELLVMISQFTFALGRASSVFCMLPANTSI